MRFTVVFVFVLLSGCFPGSIETLKRDARARGEFSIQQPYQLIYRNLLTGMRGCREASGLLIGGDVVEGQIYTDLNYGEITLRQMAPHGPQMFSVIEVKKDGAGTMVKVFEFSRIKDPTESLKRWASGDATC